MSAGDEPVSAGSGKVTPPPAPPHRCQIPDPQPYVVGSTFECECGNTWKMVETPDRPDDRWDIGKRWAVSG